MGLPSTCTYIALLCFVTTIHLYWIKGVWEKLESETYVEEPSPNASLQKFKLHYHVTPPFGCIIAPNGFLFYNDQYHLFYQFYTHDTQWEPIHWGHEASPDLVTWRRLPTTLRPEHEQCISGSAIENNGIMVLFYTALAAGDDPLFHNESQNMAFRINGVDFHQYDGNPVALYPPNGSYDPRDPKIWQYGNYWYVVLGSKSADYRGLYRSRNMTKWYLQSVLAESCCREVDYGHDFYATQTTERNGKRYLIAWFGMWGSAHPEDAKGWVGAMRLVRELDIIGSRLLMKPVAAISKLRMKNIIHGEFEQNSSLEFEKTAEIIVDVTLNMNIKLEIVGAYGGDKISVRWNAVHGKVMVVRAGDARQMKWVPLDNIAWRIFLDASSLEIFCGEGEVVFSSRIYPNGDWRVINRSAQSLRVEAYMLNKSILYF